MKVVTKPHVIEITISPAQGCDGTLLFCKWVATLQEGKRRLCSSPSVEAALSDAARILFSEGMTTATTTLVARLDSEDVIFDGTIQEAARLCTRAAANDNRWPARPPTPFDVDKGQRMASKEPVNIEPRSTKNVIKTAQAAEYLGVAAQTLCKWRCVGGGPRFVKFGRAVGYRISDLDEWAAGRVCNSTSDPNYQTMPDPANDNESLDQTA